MLGIENLTKTFPARHHTAEPVTAVAGISLHIKEGEFFTLLGPSGCGKSTTLRCIAGLERPDRGEIRLHDRVLFSAATRINVTPDKRNLGMVFQSYAIWAHMDVRRNMAFPLQMLPRSRRPSKRVIRDRVDEVLAVVRLDGLGQRMPSELSGGQQQRLALARALVTNPALLLLDEPLSNLDAKLRAEMRLELKRLQRELDITTIYVTHDQVEALSLSDVIAVLNHGVVEQLGPPREIYERPQSEFVAGFIGGSNHFAGTVTAVRDDGLVDVDTALGPVVGLPTVALEIDDPVLVGIRPEDLVIVPPEEPRGTKPGGRTPPGASPANTWHGRMVAREFLGHVADHRILVRDHELRARCSPLVTIAGDADVRVAAGADRCVVMPVRAGDRARKPVDPSRIAS